MMLLLEGQRGRNPHVSWSEFSAKLRRKIAGCALRGRRASKMGRRVDSPGAWWKFLSHGSHDGNEELVEIMMNVSC